jgi:hypothetical protein
MMSGLCMAGPLGSKNKPQIFDMATSTEFPSPIFQNPGARHRYVLFSNPVLEVSTTTALAPVFEV